MSVPFVHGLNDDFWIYAATADANTSMSKAQNMNCSAVRTSVYWNGVEPTSSGDAVWTNPAVPYDLANLRSMANGKQLKVVPIILGCPTWIPADQRAQTPSGNWYPTSADAASKFGDFVVKTARFFDECGTIDAIEIWNEPNLGYLGSPSQRGPFLISYAPHFSQMLSFALCKMQAAADVQPFSRSITVVSGGLAMGTLDDWQGYLTGYESQSLPYALGVHPYDLSTHSNLNNVDARADAVVSAIEAKFDDVKNRTYSNPNRDIWVTETGASSRDEFGQSGQNRILRKLAGISGANPDEGVFAKKTRCKAVFIHRLYGDFASGTPTWKFSLQQADWTPKQAFDTLKAHWA